MTIKVWEIPAEDSEKVDAIKEQAGCSTLVARLLAVRGCQPSMAAELLADKVAFADPFLLPDIELAVARIKVALANNERMTIFGDYDVDGITSVVVLFDYLRSCGGIVDYYIPDRKSEGYGLNFGAIDKLANAGTKLIITVDNGIVAVDEVARANNLGVDVIVTDHHTTRGDLPAAIAVVNPMREEYAGFKKIAGVMVVFKLIVALEEGRLSPALQRYGALVCLGTVADAMPLVDENRCITKIGLALLENPQLAGLKALKEVARIQAKLTAKDIAFLLAPRINATARLNVTQLAIDLLLCDDPGKCAKLAEEIEEKNKQRKKIEREVFAAVCGYLQQHPEEQDRRIPVFVGDGWHDGVIGIVAARISAVLDKPCLIISVDGNLAKGSGRSVEGFSLIDALVSVGDLLVKYGGHKVAVGFTLELANVPDFRRRLEVYAQEAAAVMPVGKLCVDLLVNISDLSVGNAKSIEVLAPFGEGNPVPHFLLQGLKIHQIVSLCGGKYVKLQICEPAIISLLCFHMRVQECVFVVGDIVDAVVTCGWDLYEGNEQLTVKVVALRPNGLDEAECLRSRADYESFKTGGPCNKTKLCPSKQEITTVYRCIRQQDNCLDVLGLFMKVCKFGVPYGKFLVVLDVLSELGLVSVSGSVKINPVTEKKDLAASAILRALA
ncbi:MAG: single-stranded-DNA-specific exonuclease RecJ [Oscillospiraceae bacterium]|jgi:single-stranded-DNA-specific exonuclease|nr:single-stranded-DNA-specific exonuclease RecJ [Oscillospiraceae bacterium]